jgi:hypothetical protein
MAATLLVAVLSSAQPPTVCRVQAVTFEGWKAQQISNPWVTITIVPQLGGRVMQVSFGGHSYLFVNPKLKGQYFPPTPSKWFNYGGDKLWPLPEGTEDDQHWPGPVADVLDDGEYIFSVLSSGKTCRVQLEGPADAKTGLQYSREISVEADSPRITFAATMKNASQRPIRWSIQSVTQYDTSAAARSAQFNPEFFAFTGANPNSAYMGGYTLRLGEAEDPAFTVNNGLFRLHYTPFQREIWVDSPSGWLAVVDGSSGFAMVERFPHDHEEYPGGASVIFYTNGAALEFDSAGVPHLTSRDPAEMPYYMEAEVNSPMVTLEPGRSYTLRTSWYPTRSDSDIKAITDVGVINIPLSATWNGDELLLSGSFGVFYPGKLVAHFFNGHGEETGRATLASVSPLESLHLHATLAAPKGSEKVVLSIATGEAESGVLAEANIASKLP